MSQPNHVSPVFIIGRQHSGNTLLATILGRSPDVFSLRGEGTFFEHRAELRPLAPPERADRVAELIGSGASSPHEVSSRLKEVLSGSNGATSASALDLYRQGMEHLAAQHGKTRWAQKATSYIFYVDEILDAFRRPDFFFWRATRWTSPPRSNAARASTPFLAPCGDGTAG
jgi:hypothetical protein